MSENPKRKRILQITAYAVVIVAFLVTLGFSEHRQDVMPCTEVEVVIIDTLGHNFVEEGEIMELVRNKFGSLKGKPLSSINISLLEKIINTNPFIADAEVFSTIDGKIKIEVKQRKPVVRIVNVRDESFYIDDQGEFMPLSKEYTARVAIANGFIFDTESERRVTLYDGEKRDTAIKLSRIDEIFHVADYIYHHEFWNAQIEQIYVNAEGDIELIPRVGSQNIVLGSSEKLEKKLNKLFLFYREGLNKTGWNKYKTINLKYEGQVVCTKK
ncbi:MAG: cell division protein FtsQ/DivIB [Bacteroidota bacterium]